MRDLGKFRRAVRMAYQTAKTKIPVDTGSLKDSLTLKETMTGFTIEFNGDFPYRKNTNKHVRDYINYVENYHTRWWENYVDTFAAELALQLNAELKKRK